MFFFSRYSLSNMTHNPFPTVNSRIQYFWWYKKRKWKREKGVSNVKSIYFENWEIYCKRKASEGWQSSFWQENNPLIFISRRVEALFSRNQKTSMAGKERERERVWLSTSFQTIDRIDSFNRIDCSLIVIEKLCKSLQKPIIQKSSSLCLVHN